MEKRKVTQRFYTTKDAATYLGLAQRTLQKYRVDGSGPKFRKVRPTIARRKSQTSPR